MRGKNGFALPLVLTLVAVLTLTFAVCIVALRGLKAQTLLAIKGVEFEQAAMTAEARMAFLMTTEPFGAGSIDIGAARQQGAAGSTTATTSEPTAQVFLDNRLYRWLATADAEPSGYLIGVQDEAGLVNLFQSDAQQLTRLFQWAGVSDRDAGNLANAIVTYNADPEAHQPMRRPAEIYRVEGAVDILTDKVWRKLAERATLYPDNRSVNINTAPAEVLQAWFDLSESQAADIVERQKDETFTSVTDIGVVVADQNRNYAFSGGRLRFSFTDPATGLVRRSTLVLTPTSATRPVWIENPRTLRLPPPETPEDDLDDFPQVPDLAS